MFLNQFVSAALTLALSCTTLASTDFVAAADSVAPSVTDYDTSTSELRGFIEQYAADRGNLFRFYTAPLSPARNARLKQFYSETMANLNKNNFGSLSFDGRADFVLLKNHLEQELAQLEIQSKQNAELEPLLPFAPVIIAFEESRRRLEPIDSEKVAATLNDLKKQIADTRKKFEAALKPEGRGDAKQDAKAVNESKPDAKPATPPVKRTVANRAYNSINALKATMKNWFDYFNGYDPLFTWWNADPYKQADAELQAYATFVREKLAGIKPDDKTTIIGDPVGRESILKDLRANMIPYTPEELIAIAKKELSWCESEMIKASRELGYGDDWHKALEHVKDLHVAPGKQPDLIRDLALEAIQYLEQHDLVTIPAIAKDTWRMEMMSPERQLVSPFFLGGETILVSYPTSTMTHEQKLMSMRGNNNHFSRSTVFHELIPGHHLQGYMSARYKSHRRVFATPFWHEGNAFYWEMLFWDMGFPKTPENRIGMLFWRMHRCARVMFSLGFHLGQLTPEECVKLLVDRVGHELDNATAEVRRSFDGSYPPIYQCAYFLGAHQFYALHKELVDGGKMTNKQFHDAILHEGPMPVEMVRAILTKQTLSPDFKTSWRFEAVPTGGN
ncbi:MAG: DUF885 family protein [Acidobacteria bacterium]|nr:DUF885 family protein [Acidobacteriota bacterium]